MHYIEKKLNVKALSLICTNRYPCISLILKATYEARLRALEGAVSAQKAFQGPHWYVIACALPETKDKLEDMDVSLIKEGVRLVAIIFRTCLQPNRWTYITSFGTK